MTARKNVNVWLCWCLSLVFFCPSDTLNRKRSEQVRGWLSPLGRLRWASTWVTTGICSQTHSRAQKETHRWHLSPLSCIASPQCLFLMGIRSTKHIWLNLAQNEFEKTITSLYFFFVSLLSLNVFPHYYPDIPIGITKLLLYLLTNYYHTITMLLLSCKIKWYRV